MGAAVSVASKEKAGPPASFGQRWSGGFPVAAKRGLRAASCAATVDGGAMEEDERRELGGPFGLGFEPPSMSPFGVGAWQSDQGTIAPGGGAIGTRLRNMPKFRELEASLEIPSPRKLLGAALKKQAHLSEAQGATVHM